MNATNRQSQSGVEWRQNFTIGKLQICLQSSYKQGQHLTSATAIDVFSTTTNTSLQPKMILQFQKCVLITSHKLLMKKNGTVPW